MARKQGKISENLRISSTKSRGISVRTSLHDRGCCVAVSNIRNQGEFLAMPRKSLMNNMLFKQRNCMDL